LRWSTQLFHLVLRSGLRGGWSGQVGEGGPVAAPKPLRQRAVHWSAQGKCSGRWSPGRRCGRDRSAHGGVMTISSMVPAGAGEECALDGARLSLAVAAYLARFKRTVPRDPDSDMRAYLG
jgi:hypothetical protein